jgi:hypothetical protein
MLFFCFIALFAAAAHAGVQYEFRQITRSDVQQLQKPEVTGRGLIEGPRTRIDFHSGSSYGPGTYVITENGGKRVVFVSSVDKTYAEIDIASMASQMGANQIKVSNMRTDFKKLEDKTIIAGLPTEHYKLEAKYDITRSFGELSITQSVHTVVEKWTTAAFGDVADDFFASGFLQTGNADLDSLIEAESGKFSGFPLRQTVTVTTTIISAPQHSNLQVKPQRRQISEMIVTAIEAREVPSSQFSVPAGYKKVDRPKALERNATENVTLQ